MQTVEKYCVITANLMILPLFLLLVLIVFYIFYDSCDDWLVANTWFINPKVLIENSITLKERYQCEHFKEISESKWVKRASFHIRIACSMAFIF